MNELAGRGRFVFEIVLSGGKVFVAELIDRDRALDVLQAVFTEVADREPSTSSRADFESRI